jgi:hypothetical protein
MGTLTSIALLTMMCACVFSVRDTCKTEKAAAMESRHRCIVRATQIDTLESNLTDCLKESNCVVGGRRRQEASTQFLHRIKRGLGGGGGQRKAKTGANCVKRELAGVRERVHSCMRDAGHQPILKKQMKQERKQAKKDKTGIMFQRIFKTYKQAKRCANLAAVQRCMLTKTSIDFSQHDSIKQMRNRICTAYETCPLSAPSAPCSPPTNATKAARRQAICTCRQSVSFADAKRAAYTKCSMTEPTPGPGNCPADEEEDENETSHSADVTSDDRPAFCGRKQQRRRPNNGQRAGRRNGQ